MQERVRGSRSRGDGRRKEEDGFSFKQIPGAFMSLPRVMRLVWSTSWVLTISLAVLSVLQGFAPAASVWITKLVVDGVVQGIRIHSPSPIWLPVGLQLGVAVLSNLLSSLNDTGEGQYAGPGLF